MASASPRVRGASSKGLRRKHVPQRMCVSCRERSAKRTLIRLVRTPDSSVEVDPTGKRNGRGAYLCDDPACWERALSSGRLAQALKTTIDAETLHRLRRFASDLPPRAGLDAEPGQEGTDE